MEEKIERIPNEIYITYKRDELNLICEKLKEVRDCELTPEKAFEFMYSGLFNKRVFPFVTYREDKKLNSCLILSVGQSLISDLSLYVIFIWIDKESPELWKKIMEFVETMAKSFKVSRIIGSTKRVGFGRKLREYGYKETYRIIEKIIKEVI